MINSPPVIKPNPNKYIYTANTNFINSGYRSIYGTGDKLTIHKLKQIKIIGKWLNLAAGDGRYCNYLYKNIYSLDVVDIDSSALIKLIRNIPVKYRNKIKRNVFNIINKFPFNNNCFDGLLCTGALHLFPKNVLKSKIIPEIKRVLKKDGLLIFDFAFNIRRIKNNGELVYIYKNEPKYNITEIKKLIIDQFSNFTYNIYIGSVYDDLTEIKELNYMFNCKYVLFIGKKLSANTNNIRSKLSNA